MSYLVNLAVYPVLRSYTLQTCRQVLRPQTSCSCSSLLSTASFTQSGITSTTSTRKHELSSGFDCQLFVRFFNTHVSTVVNSDFRHGQKLTKWTNLLMNRSKFTSSSSFSSSTSVSNPHEKQGYNRLQKVQELMNLQIPAIISRRHEYRIYTADVIFQNNWDIENPRQTVGIAAYVFSVVKARLYMHSNYAKIKVTVLSSEINEASSTVKVQWRISYLPQAKAFMFWKYKPFKFRAIANQLSDSIDGVSTFHVNTKGFIYKHVLDRVHVEKVTEIEPN